MKMETLSREEIVALDKQYIWHPYTQMQTYIADEDPVVVDSARGVFLFEKDGTRLLDGNGSWWTSIVGHNHPSLMEAIVERTRTMVHCSMAGTTHEPAARLARQLIETCGDPHEKVFFSDDGSTAVEVAVRMAYQYWRNLGRPGKRRFVSLSEAFHGETVGCASVSGVEVFHDGLKGLLFDRVLLPSPGVAGGKDEEPWYEAAFASAADILKTGREEIAAVIVEPLVQGAAGMLMYPAAYLSRLKALCDELDILLIADEVFVGYGRTGTFLAHHQAGFGADIVCLAKGFSGGELPMAATVVSRRIFDAFLGGPDKTLWYGHSFTGNPLGCAVAGATLEVIARERLMETLPEKCALIQKGLDRISVHPWVRDPRRTGIIGAWTLCPPDAPSGARYLDDAGWRFYRGARQRGALLRPLGNVVYFVLPLTVTAGEIQLLFDIVEDTLHAVF